MFINFAVGEIVMRSFMDERKRGGLKKTWPPALGPCLVWDRECSGPGHLSIYGGGVCVNGWP